MIESVNMVKVKAGNFQGVILHSMLSTFATLTKSDMNHCTCPCLDAIDFIFLPYEFLFGFLMVNESRSSLSLTSV